VPEPGNPQELNRYSYCRNAALRFRDPSGRFSEEELTQWGFTGDVIARWKADKLWWEFISAAKLGDLAKAAVPYLVDKPREVAAYFFLIPKAYNLPELLEIEGFSSLEQFRRYTTDRELWFRDERGQWQQRLYCTAFIGAPQPELRIWFDADAVDWKDVGLDVAGMASFGLAKLAKRGKLAAAASRAEAAITGWQLGDAGAEMAKGTADWRTKASATLSAFGTVTDPRLAALANLASLLIDLSPGVKVEYR